MKILFVLLQIVAALPLSNAQTLIGAAAVSAAMTFSNMEAIALPKQLADHRMLSPTVKILPLYQDLLLKNEPTIPFNSPDVFDIIDYHLDQLISGQTSSKEITDSLAAIEKLIVEYPDMISYIAEYLTKRDTKLQSQLRIQKYYMIHHGAGKWSWFELLCALSVKDNRRGIVDLVEATKVYAKAKNGQLAPSVTMALLKSRKDDLNFQKILTLLYNPESIKEIKNIVAKETNDIWLISNLISFHNKFPTVPVITVDYVAKVLKPWMTKKSYGAIVYALGLEKGLESQLRSGKLTAASLAKALLQVD